MAGGCDDVSDLASRLSQGDLTTRMPYFQEIGDKVPSLYFRERQTAFGLEDSMRSPIAGCLRRKDALTRTLVAGPTNQFLANRILDQLH